MIVFLSQSFYNRLLSDLVGIMISMPHEYLYLLSIYLNNFLLDIHFIAKAGSFFLSEPPPFCDMDI